MTKKNVTKNEMTATTRRYAKLDPRTVLEKCRARILEETPALIEILIKEAKKGDVPTIKYLVDKVIITPKEAQTYVDIAESMYGDFRDVGSTVEELTLNGKLSIEDATKVIGLSKMRHELMDTTIFKKLHELAEKQGLLQIRRNSRYGKNVN